MVVGGCCALLMLVEALEFCELAPAPLPPPDPLAALRLRTAMYVRWVCVDIAGPSASSALGVDQGEVESQFTGDKQAAGHFA